MVSCENMRTLTEPQITAMMKKVRGWTRTEDAIERTWRFRTFMEAVAFMNRGGTCALECAQVHSELFRTDI
jgi:pterin-4a-carbinolamine dehydratase